jgi:hypothetical protein
MKSHLVGTQGRDLRRAILITQFSYFDVPTLVLEGGNVSHAGLFFFNNREEVKLIVVDGTPHGMGTALKERINAKLLPFSKA